MRSLQGSAGLLTNKKKNGSFSQPCLMEHKKKRMAHSANHVEWKRRAASSQRVEKKKTPRSGMHNQTRMQQTPMSIETGVGDVVAKPTVPPIRAPCFRRCGP
mmetsp:Transcript_125977/g.350990  ORF Transcript_125977/g.350990 Transcript_125977/m.350990 type:complete len:102 (-) Transcript_125977:499-804(-)